MIQDYNWLQKYQYVGLLQKQWNKKYKLYLPIYSIILITVSTTVVVSSIESNKNKTNNTKQKLNQDTIADIYIIITVEEDHDAYSWPMRLWFLFRRDLYRPLFSQRLWHPSRLQSGQTRNHGCQMFPELEGYTRHQFPQTSTIYT